MVGSPNAAGKRLQAPKVSPRERKYPLVYSGNVIFQVSTTNLASNDTILESRSELNLIYNYCWEGMPLLSLLPFFLYAMGRAKEDLQQYNCMIIYHHYNLLGVINLVTGARARCLRKPSCPSTGQYLHNWQREREEGCSCVS